MKEAQEKQKAGECSVTQFVEESSSSEDEEEFETCDVCLKDKAHCTCNCPYLDCIPNAKDVTVGNGFELVCKKCNVFGVHAACSWKGSAIMKRCRICHKVRLHWTSECQKNPNPQPFGLFFSKLIMSKKTVMSKTY